MADDKKSWWESLGAMFQQKDEDKKKKNATDTIKKATDDKNAALNDLYNYGSGKGG